MGGLRNVFSRSLLTVYYSHLRGGVQGGPGPANFWNNEYKRLFKKAQSWFVPVVLNGILGHPRLKWHTWQCPCFSVSSGGNVPSESKALKGPCQLKKPSKTPGRRQGREEQKKTVFPQRGVIWFALNANQWFFTYLPHPLIFDSLLLPWLISP